MAKPTKYNKKDIFGEKPKLSKADIFGVAGVDLPEQKTPDFALNLIQEGLNIQQLATIFRLTHTRARDLMAMCPPIKKRAGGWLYTIADAAPYLSTPKMTIEEYIKITKVKDLPHHLQTEIYTSYERMMNVLERTQQLWHNENVVDSLSDLFKVLKDGLHGLPSKMHNLGQLTEEQRPAFTEALNELCEILADKVIAHLEKNSPPNYTAKFEQDHKLNFEALVDGIRQ